VTIPTQEEILRAVKPDALNTLSVNAPDESEVEEEVIESAEVPEDIDGVESIEPADSDDDTTAEDEDEPDDDEVYLEYTLNGEKLKVNLADDADLAKVKTALEKQGLEVKTQHAVEGQKAAERRAEAAEIKLREHEAMREAQKPLDPWVKAVEDPAFRAAVARQNPRANLPQVNYNPEVAKMAAENARLKRQQAQEENSRELGSIETHVMTQYGLDGNQLGECVAYLNSRGLSHDPNRSVKEQRAYIVELVGMAKDALVGQGKLPNPEVQKAKAETEKATKKLLAAKKRRAARNPSPGTGVAAAKSGTPGADLKGAGIDAVLAEFKRRSGK